MYSSLPQALQNLKGQFLSFYLFSVGVILAQARLTSNATPLDAIRREQNNFCPSPTIQSRLRLSDRYTRERFLEQGIPSSF